MKVAALCAYALVALVACVHAQPGDNVTTYASLPEALTSEPQLSSLLELVQQANLTDALSDPALVATVLAPTNDAVEEALSTVSGLNITLTQNQTRDILLYHVLPGAALTSTRLVELAPRNFSTLLEGEKVQVTLGNSTEDSQQAGGARRLLQPAPAAEAPTLLINEATQVVTPDIRAGGSVVHVIDGVLLPPNFIDRLLAESSQNGTNGSGATPPAGAGDTDADAGSDAAATPGTSGAGSFMAGALAMVAPALALVLF